MATAQPPVVPVQPTLKPSTTVAPSSEIIICKGVPFGLDYSSTILFDSYQAQRAFFVGKQKYTCNAMKPFTLGEPIRVPYPAEQMYECNYIYFTSQTSARHWCAFITNIVRVNQQVSDIEYALDVLQNWQLEWTLNPCMVLREHAEKDSPGDNLQPEPLDFGDYIYNKYMTTGLFDKYSVMIFWLGDSAKTDKPTAGIYQPTSIYFFDMTESNTYAPILDFLGNYFVNPDIIINISMFPTKFKNSYSATQALPISVDISGLKYADLQGYVPRNKKLFTYPYNMIYVTDMDGNAVVWRYEWFGNINKLTVDCACAPTTNARAIMAPYDYAGYVNKINWEEKISMNSFPQCSWLTDTYKAYLAQNTGQNNASLLQAGISAVSGVATMAAGGASQNPGIVLGGASQFIGAVKSADSTLNQARTREIQPESARGNYAADSIFSVGEKDFHIFQRCIQADYAAALDSFFDQYGYAVNKVKTPNLKSRLSWNYIQTENCQLTGEIALDDLATLNAIFNRGVTFWHGDFVGQYGRSNAIVSGSVTQP